MSKRFHIATFGCRANQADSAALRQDLLDRDYQETEDWTAADVIVVNSCTVTHRSDQQVRQLTRRLRRDNPEARLYVTGCYAQRSPRALAQIPGVDGVFGNTRKSDLVQLALGEGSPAITHGEPAAIYRDDFRKVRSIDWTPATAVGGKTRPFVKIQDGCDAKCSYCIIPAVRGPSRSVPPAQILAQVRALVDNGFCEVVLTGIHIGTYGQHLAPRFPLDRLLAEITAIEGLRRVRVSSIEPMELSRRVIDLAADCPKIAPHFHICLQSGCDRTLRRMLRPYNTARFGEIVESIRRKIPDAAIGTDIIGGFPGETEEDHRAGLSFVERMPFTYLHVFPYSDRTGTSASQMTDKVHPQTRARRCREFRELSERKSAAFRQSFLGRRLSVLTLSELDQNQRLGLSANYLRVKLEGPPVEANRIVEAQVMRIEDDFICSALDRTTNRQKLRRIKNDG